MTDFASNHISRWKDGSFFNLEDAVKQGRVVVVNYDQTNNAYFVDEPDQADFLEWVAINWHGDDDIQEEDETTEAFLDQLGISVRELSA